MRNQKLNRSVRSCSYRACQGSSYARLVRNLLVLSGDSPLTSATAGMAVVAINAVVHIPVHVRVLEVSGVVIAMAARALEYRVVSTIRVACGAYAVCIAMAGGKLRVGGMRERRAGPIDRAHAVAGPALCGWEESGVLRRGMRWTGRAVVIGLMAGDAGIAV